MSWVELLATWNGLTQLMDSYHIWSHPFQTLCEARRLVEVEMRNLGFEDEWEALTKEMGGRERRE